MWILLNDRPVNVLDITEVSPVTTVSKEDWVDRLNHDCDYWATDKSSLVVALRAIKNSGVYKEFPNLYFKDYGSLVCTIRDNWNKIQRIFPDSISWFSIKVGATQVTSDMYPTRYMAVNTRDKLLTLINTTLAGIPKIHI